MYLIKNIISLLQSVKHLFLVVLFSTILFHESQGQYVDLLRLQGNDTIEDVTSYRFTVWIKNVTADTLKNYDVELNYTTEWHPASLYSLGIVNLNSLSPEDSIAKEIGFPGALITPPVNEGPNIVVVWPTGTSLIPDTITKQVYYKRAANSIHELLDYNPLFELFPVPCSNTLSFKSDIKAPIESVKIYDYTGRAMIRQDAGTNQLNVQPLADGIYFICIRYKGYAPVIRKFTKYTF